PLYPAQMSVDTEATITLTYSDEDADQAQSCSLYNLQNVTVTTPCLCNSGTCTVGVTGTSGYTGAARFDYRVNANGQQSNMGTASLDIQ
ncbi:MAG: hypothetical protein KDD43_14965, partial [Bdellovibrionales bacterium]|nr:hypothetical protein [Bdellovibrionales bacterium]